MQTDLKIVVPEGIQEDGKQCDDLLKSLRNSSMKRSCVVV